MTDTPGVQESRSRIQAVIEAAPAPLTVESIAESTGLHANTVRSHLDILLAGGVITREAADAHGRGRPRWLYRSATPQRSPFHALAEALSVQLALVGDPTMADRAAEQWARALPDLPSAGSPDEAVAEAADALTRLGFQAQATYTLARGTDNAPLTGNYVVGSGDVRVSDPTNLDRDKGVTPFNQTHTLAVSTVFQPTVAGDSVLAYLANHNQLGIIVQANSGLPFNIISNQDLNRDGAVIAPSLNNDRPLGVERNSGRLGKVINLDLRYSRFIPFSSSKKGELFIEAKNLFNRQNISGVNRVVATDAAGNPTVDITDTTALGTPGRPFSGNAGYDQRIVQVGVKVAF